MSPRAFVIPFNNEIKTGTTGKFVMGAKRAIWRANGIRLTAFTPVFGPVAVQQLKKFQSSHNLHPDGVLGAATLQSLAPYFDAYAYLLYVGYPPGGNKRNAIVAYCWWGYNNRDLIHYAQQRPMDLLSDLHHLPVWNDCSEFVTKAYKFAGAPDPNGSNYNGYGFTGTLAQHGKLVTLEQAQALPGDLVLYGNPPTFEHVAVYIGNRKVISHGSEPGPYYLPIDYRNDRGEIRSYL